MVMGAVVENITKYLYSKASATILVQPYEQQQENHKGLDQQKVHIRQQQRARNWRCLGCGAH